MSKHTNAEQASAVRNEAVASCRAAGISLADIGRVLILPPVVNVTVGGLDDGVTYLGCRDCREVVVATLEPSIERATPPVHKHTCHLCGEDYPCTELNCGILDKYAVCDGVVCGMEWDALSEAEDDEPHRRECSCVECHAGDYDPREQPYPAR